MYSQLMLFHFQSTFKTDRFHDLCQQWNQVLKFQVSSMPLVRFLLMLHMQTNCILILHIQARMSHNPELVLEPYPKQYEILSKTGDVRKPMHAYERQLHTYILATFYCIVCVYTMSMSTCVRTYVCIYFICMFTVNNPNL